VDLVTELLCLLLLLLLLRHRLRRHLLLLLQQLLLPLDNALLFLQEDAVLAALVQTETAALLKAIVV